MIKKIKIIGHNEYVETIIDDEDDLYFDKYTWFAKFRKPNKRTKKKIYYICRQQKKPNKTIYLHKLICPSEHPLTTDHINGNSLDNRRANLRVATRSQQCANSIPSIKNKTSKFRGVKLIRTKKCIKFVGKTKLNNKTIHLGTFQTELEAARAYDEFAIKTWGEFATLNFPPTCAKINMTVI